MRVLIKNILNTIIFNIYYKKIMNIIISLYFDTYIYKKQNSKKHSSKKQNINNYKLYIKL